LLTAPTKVKEMPHKKSAKALLMLLLGMFFISPDGLAQQSSENQLPREMKSALSKAVEDTAKINILLDSANHIQQKNPIQALTYCFHALRLARAVPSENHIDRALLKIGSFLYQSGAFEEAMRYYQEYQKRALKSGNIVNQLKVRHNIIALKLVITNKFDEDLYSEMNALLADYKTLWQQSGDSMIVREMMPSLLINLLQTAIAKGALDEADEFLKAAIDLTKRYQISEKNILHLYLSDYMLKAKMGKFEEAAEKAGEIRDRCIQSDNLVILNALEYYQGNAMAEKGDLEKAIQSYESAYKLAEKLDNHSAMAESANKLYEIYQKKGNLENALKYNNAAKASKESMKAMGAASRIAESEMLERMHILEQEMKMEQRSRTNRFLVILVIFLALFLAVVLLFFKIRKKYELTSQEKEAYAMQANQSSVEKEVLASALEEKDKQLATEVMYRVQKNEIIKEVMQKLQDAHPQFMQDAQREMAEAIKGLERAVDDHSWEDFELRFLQVHQGFYDRLQELNLKLTTNERRLCAFLKLGMNSKEISAITGQSIQSITKARHRLRKKLGLPDQETSLIEFFANF
jgi:tetratricopeptide (TPR) repeat protein